MSDNIVMLDDIAYLPEAKVIIQAVPSREMFKEAEEPVTIDKYKIVPWGDENNLPADITDKAKKSGVVKYNVQTPFTFRLKAISQRKW